MESLSGVGACSGDDTSAIVMSTINNGGDKTITNHPSNIGSCPVSDRGATSGDMELEEAYRGRGYLMKDVTLPHSPPALVEDLVCALYGLPGESVEPGEDAVPGLAGEVAGAHHAAVVLADGLVQEHARPLPGPELGLPDELDAAGLDTVHVHVHADDE